MTKHPDNANTEMLSAYVDGQLSEEERVTFESELDRDPELQSLLEQWRSLGNAFRDLPKHSLPKDFSNRVMTQINGESLPAVLSTGRTISRPTLKNPSNTSARKTAFALIGSLAAMLLLTLTIAPQWINHQSSQTTPPSLEDSDPGSDRSANPNAQASIGTKEPVTANDSQVPTDSSDAKEPFQVSKRRVFISRPLAMSINQQKKQSGVVESVIPIIEQILVFDFAKQSDRHLNGLTAELKSDPASSFRVLKNADPSLKSLLPKRVLEGSESPSQAMLVVTTNSAMKKAIERLQAKTKVSVRAISLISDAESDDNGGSNESTAQAIPVFDLLSNASDIDDVPTELDPLEAERLDRWFGLSSKPDAASQHQFLIMVK